MRPLLALALTALMMIAFIVMSMPVQEASAHGRRFRARRGFVNVRAPFVNVRVGRPLPLHNRGFFAVQAPVYNYGYGAPIQQYRQPQFVGFCPVTGQAIYR